ncbi:MAG: ABC transporter substrate-binding protein [Gemmatimonadaceae bacterium]|nr:ABC transporter substrate-binding protein [Gemmatimonadaceae bacterium]
MCAVAVAAVLAAACSDGVARPAIGFTYNWGDSPLERFVEHALNDGVRPRDSLRLVFESRGGWQQYGSSTMAAEVRRASLIAADSEVLAVIGPGGSREALQVAPIYAEAGVAMIVPTGTSRLLAGAGDHVLRLAPDDSVQGEFIAAFADTALGAKSLAVFHVPDEYGIGLAAGTASTAAARGLQILVRTPIALVRACGDRGDGDAYYARLATDLARRGRPDAVVLAMRTVEAGCLATALRARWPGIVLIAGDGVYLDTPLFNSAGTAVDGMYLVAFWHPEIPSARAREFAVEYRRVTGREPRHGDAVFVDGALLVAQAIRGGARSRPALLRALRETGTRRPAFEGYSGTISFASDARRPLWMTRIVGRGSVLLAGR